MKSKSPGRSTSRGVPKEQGSSSPEHKNDLLIAAIGASAGGIEPSTELATPLPHDTAMPFVLVHHLNPDHKSLLTELISKKPAMRVREVTEGMAIEPDHFTSFLPTPPCPFPT